MSNYKGVIGSLQKAIFNETAKNADNTYKLGQGLAKFAAGGALAGSVGTSSMTVYNNYSEGRDLTNGLGMSALRGAALGTVIGTGSNVVPKLVHNSMAKTGITAFDGFGKIAEDLAETWAPVAVSLKIANHKPKTAEGKKSMGAMDKYFKLSKEVRKEVKAKGVKNLKNSGDFSYTLQSKVVSGIDPEGFVKGSTSKAANSFSLDDLVKLTAVNGALGKATEDTAKFNKDKESVKALAAWSTDTSSKLEKISKVQRGAVGSALLTNLGFKSTYHHIVEPTGDFFKNIRKGKFKDITWEQVAGTAFSGYGLYETGLILNDASEGDVKGVITGLGILAGSKLAYGAATDYAKFEAIRRAKRLSYNNMYQAFKMQRDTSTLIESSGHLSLEQEKELNALFKKKATDIANFSAPNTTKVVQEMGETLNNPSSLFTENLKATHNLLEAIGKDAARNGKDADQITDIASKYITKYPNEVMGMSEDVMHSNIDSVREWNTKYSNILSELRKDFMQESVDVNYSKVLDQLESRNKMTQMSGAADLLYGTKAFAGREGALKETISDIRDPWSEVRKPTLWLELARDFALGAGTTYAVDYAVRGEDASIPGAILLGGGIQLATGAHILGNPKKYFAKHVSK